MDWKEYYISIAKAVSAKSKDPSTKVGAVIVDKDNRVVSQGFNGFVKGCNEHSMTFEKPMKYNLIIHAEMNALVFSRRDLTGCTVYCTHGPCENCLKHMLQAGIKTIIYEDAGIMRRGSDDSKEAIYRLVKATGAKVESLLGVNYVEDIYFDIPLTKDEVEGLFYYRNGRQYSMSTFIDGTTTTYGYGPLDNTGWFESPLRPEFIEKYKQDFENAYRNNFGHWPESGVYNGKR